MSADLVWGRGHGADLVREGVLADIGREDAHIWRLGGGRAGVDAGGGRVGSLPALGRGLFVDIGGGGRRFGWGRGVIAGVARVGSSSKLGRTAPTTG
ncbi:hypothetical protein TIFTF001_014447 [Ficus carica]|uniref:Uncharacterized protein n=1 Tax=Ficus carica TaxID=3494 RepID=A0AA88A3R4_FICCA|nr:hypothetical protein TIFTF001_014447 [Ficus carica]